MPVVAEVDSRSKLGSAQNSQFEQPRFQTPTPTHKIDQQVLFMDRVKNNSLIDSLYKQKPINESEQMNLEQRLLSKPLPNYDLKKGTSPKMKYHEPSAPLEVSIEQYVIDNKLQMPYTITFDPLITDFSTPCQTIKLPFKSCRLLVHELAHEKRLIQLEPVA